MSNQNSEIKIERFINAKYVKKDCFIVLLFLLLFLIIGSFEKNLMLPNNGLGLLQHKNIWIFLALNAMIPIIIQKSFKSLSCNIGEDTFKKLKKNYESLLNFKSTAVLWNFSRAVGFCFFIGNTLQNAKVINQLPFDYWDSINYPISYIVSRFYKLYLFSFFIPTVLVYIFVLIRALSKLTVITDTKKYPIANDRQLNALCSFGLNILLTVLIPFIISSIAVYLVHDRFDITTITTIIVSVLCTMVSLYAYILLIKDYYVSLSNYKNEHIEQINNRLAKIHQYVLDFQFNETSSKKLEIYLKEEAYLYQIKERIEKQSKFPNAIKASVTCVSPLLPTLFKIISSLEIPFSG